MSESLFTPDELADTLPADEYYAQERADYERYMAEMHRYTYGDNYGYAYGEW